MKIEIQKKNGISSIFLDGKPVSRCMGFDISSSGSGFATVNLRFLAKDLDLSVDTDEPMLQAQEPSEVPRKSRVFHRSSPKS